MAGGKGTRLRPLTCNKPKPMVPLLNKPVMEYAIELLKQHGIREIAVTLQYLPEVIRAYFGDGKDFGVDLHYFEETIPLGTAGSVKNAEQFLDEPFLVISGDGLTDINLTEAIKFHQDNQAIATLVLTKVNNPLEFGVVITEEDGKICRFLEKPSWGEVFSDTVNSGIYILDPQIFSVIPPQTNFDFSKDVFPLLLRSKERLFGYISDGYWCDIGNLTQYRQTQFDILQGKLKVEIDGAQVRKGVWVAAGASLDVPLKGVKAPVYIGKNTHVESGAKLGEYTILGENNIIRSGASLKRTVTWNQCYLDKETELRGATVANQVTVKANSKIFEGAVIGDGCALGANSLIKPNVKLWPAKEIEESTIVHTSLVWGDRQVRNMFGQSGITGIGNIEITPDFAAKLAAAYGSTLHQGAHIILGSDEHPFSQVIVRAFAAGLLSAGVQTFDLGESTTPLTRFAVKTTHADGGLQIRLVPPIADKRVLIEFFNEAGINIDKNTERKIENAYIQEDFRRANLEAIQGGKVIPHLKDFYLRCLLEKVNQAEIKSAKLKVVVEVKNDSLLHWTTQLLAKLDCQVVTVASKDDSLLDLAKLVKDYQADLGVHLDQNGEQLVLIGKDGRIVKDELLLALLVLISFQNRRERLIAVPVTASEVMEKIALVWGGEIVRTKANPQALMVAAGPKEFYPMFDALYSLMLTLETLALNKCSLSELLEAIPDFYVEQARVQCPWSEKGMVMRKLLEDTASLTVELVDGVKVYHQDGWTLVLPDSDEPVFRVLSEASSQEVAKEMAASYADKIRAYKSKS